MAVIRFYELILNEIIRYFNIAWPLNLMFIYIHLIEANSLLF